MSELEVNAVGSQIIISSVNLYHNSVIDLRNSRAVHSVLSSPCCHLSSSLDCNTVHFGICSPLKQLDSVTFSDDSLFLKNTPPLGPLRKLSSKFEDTASRNIFPEKKSHSANSMTDINLESIDLLAADVQNNLQALVSSFVAHDKISRQKVQSQFSSNSSFQSSSPISFPSPNSTPNVLSEYIAPGSDYSQSRVKSAAAAFTRTSLDASDVSVDNKLEPESNSDLTNDFSSNNSMDLHMKEVIVNDGSSEILSSSETRVKQVDGAKIIRRQKKKTQSGSFSKVATESETDRVIKKCQELVSDIGPLSRTRDVTNDVQSKIKKLNSVENAYEKAIFNKKRQYQRFVDGDPEAKSDNGMVSEARLKWEVEFSKGSNETSLQQQMFNALGLGSAKPRRSSNPVDKLIFECPSPSIPHPKLTLTQKQHIRDRSLSPNALLISQTDSSGPSPVRPFLTKGSVAERVMLFERVPDRIAFDRNFSNTSSSNRIRPATWRSTSIDYTVKFQSHKEKDKENREPKSNLFPSRPSYQTVRRGVKSKSNIPQFYFPKGRPLSNNEFEDQLQNISKAFAIHPNGVSKNKFGEITKACGLSLYWKAPLFDDAAGQKSVVTKDGFLNYWKKLTSSHHDPASKFVHILSKSVSSHLVPDEFVPLIQDIVESHPGLNFLKEATEFHSRYIHTVIARIYYCVNRSWSGKISISELRKSNFLQVLALLDDEVDINQITDYFSYEHFYVIYCKFWELDKDHDLLIDKSDLSRHNDHAISLRMIERIFSGCVTRGLVKNEGKMSYTEFVWFLISEEDKRHPTSIEYWFRCMDIDGDGILSMYELEYFYEEQLQRMESLRIETLPFLDCLCQMLDIVRPSEKDKITLQDLKKCKMTTVFFDTFFNLEKYLDHEQRDPFASQRDHDLEGMEISDWERYAAEEYELLVAEEGTADQQDEMVYNDMDMDMEELDSNLENDNATDASDSATSRTFIRSQSNDEEFDYSNVSDNS